MVDQGVGVGALAGELESGVDAAGLIAFSDEAGVAAVVQIGDRGFAVEEREDVVAVVSFIFSFLAGGGGGVPFHVEIDLDGVVLPGGGGVVREDEAVVMNPDGETEAVTVPPGAECGGEIVVSAPFFRRVVVGTEVVAAQGDPGNVPAVCRSGREQDGKRGPFRGEPEAGPEGRFELIAFHRTHVGLKDREGENPFFSGGEGENRFCPSQLNRLRNSGQFDFQLLGFVRPVAQRQIQRVLSAHGKTEGKRRAQIPEFQIVQDGFPVFRRDAQIDRRNGDRRRCGLNPVAEEVEGLNVFRNGHGSFCCGVQRAECDECAAGGIRKDKTFDGFSEIELFSASGVGEELLRGVDGGKTVENHLLLLPGNSMEEVAQDHGGPF